MLSQGITTSIDAALFNNGKKLAGKKQKDLTHAYKPKWRRGVDLGFLCILIEPAGPEPPPAHSLGRVGEDVMGRSGQLVRPRSLDAGGVAGGVAGGEAGG